MAKLACLAFDSKELDDHSSGLIKKEFEEYQDYSSVEKLAEASQEIDAILVKFESRAKLVSLIKKIKANDQLFVLPLLLTEQANKITIADGDLNNLNQAKDQIKTINSLIDQLDIKQFDWQSKFLNFLFTRPHKKLLPAYSWHKPAYYYYPLLEYFSPEKESYRSWLNNLSEQQVLRKKELADQLFLCPECSAAHLKFTELCPNCKSIKVELSEFLHCFTCGLIAPQQQFLQEDKLICSKCHTQLRHIGEDYDRPLESGVCLDCGDYYIDSEVSVSCMLCEKRYSTDHLKKWAVYDYELTDKGRNKIRFNSGEETMGVFDKINYINPDFFYATLDWMIAMQKRYPEEVFSLIGIYFPSSLDEKYAASIQSFSEELKAILRKTDFLTRLQERYIWMLLPKTPQQGSETVLSRIKGFSKDSDDSIQDEIKMTRYSSEDLDAEQETAQLLIARLGSKL